MMREIEIFEKIPFWRQVYNLENYSRKRNEKVFSIEVTVSSLNAMLFNYYVARKEPLIEIVTSNYQLKF